MTYVNRNKRPVKRCRRGKSNGGSSINLRNQGLCLPQQFQCNYNISPKHNLFNIVWIAIIILLIGVTIFFAKIVDLNSLEFLNLIDSKVIQMPFILGSIKLSPKLTKRAQKKIKEIYGKGRHPHHNITVRDIARYHERYQRNKTSLKNKKKEIKLLKAFNKRLRAQNKELKKKRRQILLRKFLMNCRSSITMKMKIIYHLLQKTLMITRNFLKLLRKILRFN